jgi:hypothetical protein
MLLQTCELSAEAILEFVVVVARDIVRKPPSRRIAPQTFSGHGPE